MIYDEKLFAVGDIQLLNLGKMIYNNHVALLHVVKQKSA